MSHVKIQTIQPLGESLKINNPIFVNGATGYTSTQSLCVPTGISIGDGFFLENDRSDLLIGYCTLGSENVVSIGSPINQYNKNILLNTNGVERVRIDSNTGYVGINTTTPQVALDIVGEATTTLTVDDLAKASTDGKTLITKDYLEYYYTTAEDCISGKVLWNEETMSDPSTIANPTALDSNIIAKYGVVKPKFSRISKGIYDMYLPYPYDLLTGVLIGNGSWYIEEGSLDASGKVVPVDGGALTITQHHDYGTDVVLGGSFTSNSPTLFVTFSKDTNGDLIVNRNDHGLVQGNTLYFTTTEVLPTAISSVANQLYHIVSVTQNSFKVSLTYGGAAIPANTGCLTCGLHDIHVSHDRIFNVQSFTANNDLGTVNSTAHGLSVGQLVRFVTATALSVLPTFGSVDSWVRMEGRYFKVKTVPNANSFTIVDPVTDWVGGINTQYMTGSFKCLVLSPLWQGNGGNTYYPMQLPGKIRFMCHRVGTGKLVDPLEINWLFYPFEDYRYLG